MLALLMRTLSARWSATSLAATALMLAGSVTSSSTATIPGLAATTSSRLARRRPEMITLLPRLWKASASPRPMPDPQDIGDDPVSGLPVAGEATVEDDVVAVR